MRNGIKVCLSLVAVILIVSLLGACAGPTVQPSPAQDKLAVGGTPAASPAAKPAAPQQQISVDLLTCPAGTPIYVLGFAVADVAKKYNAMKISASETPGFPYNIQILEQSASLWHNTLIGSSPPDMYMATKGISPYTAPVSGMKILFTCLQMAGWLVTLDPNIKTTQDLYGKRIGIGFKTQTFGIIPNLLLTEMGVADKAKIEWIGTTPCVNALLDGTIDVAIMGNSGSTITNEWTSPGWEQLLGSGKKLYHVSFDKQAFESLKKQGWLIDYYEMPAGSLKYQDKPVTAWALTNVWTVKSVFDEEAAYQFVKMNLDHYKDYTSYYASAKLYSPQFFASYMSKATAHPGAIRAFQEQGITLP